MKNRFYLGIATLAIVAPMTAQAQETTSSIRGNVTAEGTSVAGARVTIVHVPSGTTSTASTNADGSFSASGLRVGGPFNVTVVADGYEEAQVTDIFLTAGQPLRLPVTMAQSEEIIVTASSTTASDLSTGPITTMTRSDIEGVASVSRDIRDVTRRDAFVSLDPSNSRAIEIAGQNGRLNKFSVDGIRFSDNYGLNQGGLPTARGPVPLDAIEQLSVKVAPYDVSEGDFQGGAINVVLRSGGNNFRGSAFYTYTDDSLTGKNTRGTTVPLDFKSKNYGAFLSGPIFKDKLFFAFSYEYLNESQPEALSIFGTPPSIPNITEAQANNISQLAKSLYNYDTLGFYDATPEKDEKYTAKIDWNITDGQRASFTYIHNEGNVGVAQGSSPSNISPSVGLASNAYNRGEVVDSGSFELNSAWSDTFSTDLRLNYRESATAQDPLGGRTLGQFTVCLDPTNTNGDPTRCTEGNNTTPGTGRVIFGADPSRQSNSLKYRSFGGDLTLNLSAGNHSLKGVIGYNNLSVYNIFFQNSLGTFVFDSVADFQARRASSLVLAGSLSGNINDVAADYDYNTYRFALQDSWEISDSVNLTFGARYDLYGQKDHPAFNQNFFNRHGITNTENFSGKGVLQPRFGITYDVNDRLVLRGGFGLFAGGSPDVLLANNFQNAGVFGNQVTIQRTFVGGVQGCSVSPATLCQLALDNVGDGRTFNPAVLAFLQTPAGSAAFAPVNAISKDFELPSTWKASLSANYEADFGPLGDGWLLGGDFYYSRVNNAATYGDLRSTVIGTMPDGRPRYGLNTSGGVPAGNSNPDLLLVNTTKGRGIIAVGRIEKSWDFGLSTSLSYTRQDIKDVNPMNASTANSNFGQSPTTDPNTATYGTSIYEIKDSWKFGLDYDHAFFGDYKTRFSLFGEYRSGRHFSYTMQDAGTAARSLAFGVVGTANRHLLYVPVISNGMNGDPLVRYDSQATFDGLASLINSSGLKKYQGKIAPKNLGQSPDYFKVDLHIDQEIPVPVISGARLKLFADMENVLNFIDKDWGSFRQVDFNPGGYAATTVRVACATFAGNNCAQYRYSNFSNPNVVNQRRFSLWGIRIGAKFEF